MALTSVQVALMLGMLVTGSINTLSKKAQNDVEVEGLPINGTASSHQFNHPWFQTGIMFIGEMICLFGLCIHRKRERDNWKKMAQWSGQVGHEVSETMNQPRIFQIIFAAPTICDLIGTSVAGIGLLYVDASVWQMLRGSIIIFAGILSRIFLKRKLTVLHWSGMMVTMVGLVLVGCSSVFKASHSSSSGNTILGIVLILASQLVSATQMVVEETFLKKRDFHPLQVVGMEGTFGIIMMACIALPAMYYIPGSQVGGNYENSLDALYQIKNSPSLLGFCLLYLASIAFYNYFGLAVTKSLTAVHRTLIDACRTILVWVSDLIIFYALDQRFGEPFDKDYGFLQIDGFLFLMIGTAMYNGLMDFSFLPCCRPREREMENVTSPSEDQGSIQVNDEGSRDQDERTPLLKPSDGSA